jgi:uncharacterized SAM-binding protein YcdF (DUF218 family)
VTLVRVTLTTERTADAPQRRRRSPLRRLVGAVVSVVLLALVLVPLAALGLVLVESQRDDTTPTDAIVVLGAAQFWGKPSPVLEARLGHAQSLYADDVAPRIITVGGKQPGDNTTEAQAGKSWLAGNGVPRSSVVAVREGSDTLTSLTAVAELMAEKGWTSATIVTDPAHEARSLAMARALGIEAHGSPTQEGSGTSVTLDYVARETAGLLYFWAFERRDVPQIVGT